MVTRKYHCNNCGHELEFRSKYALKNCPSCDSGQLESTPVWPDEKLREEEN